MLHRFKQNIEKQNLFSANDKILATVSGGVDSVVLCYLLKELNFNFEIAHCNFKLRGKDSDKDEQFVKQLANGLNIDFHSTYFETDEYSKENGISIQMAARDLRYTWFDKLKKEFGFDNILTAHHKNDNVETVLLNLIRGTSHKGLIGIASKKDDLVRPLLPFTKEEIIAFAKKNSIEWRKDASNESNKYKRNLIRNKVIPLLEELNPNFVNTFSENIEKFSQENLILSTQHSTLKTPVLIKNIIDSISPLLTVWNWIEQYGFTFSDAKNIVDSLDGEAGKQFLSETHRIVKDREELILEELNEDEIGELIINELGAFQLSIFRFQISKVNEVDFTLGENTAFFDAKKLIFPLTIRKWKEGDKFQPLGMKGMKKVSDYLIDIKVPLHEKQKQLVLVSGHQIAWLIGRRIDERFKVKGENNVKSTWIAE